MIYVSWCAVGAQQQMESLKASAEEANISLLCRSLELSRTVWTAWATNSLGKVISADLFQGTVCVPAHKITELQSIKNSYESAIKYSVACGASPTLEGSFRACEEARSGGTICISQGDDPEDLRKAEGGKAGWSSQPGSFAYMHDAGEQAFSANDADALQQDPPTTGYIPLQVHSEKDFSSINMLRHFKQEANRTVAAQDATPLSLDEAKARLTEILTTMKEQLPQLATLRQTNPEAYNSIMGLLQGVITLAQSVQTPPTEQLQKMQQLQKAHFDLPMPKVKRRHGLQLPVGTVNDLGPSGTRRGGKIRVQHGDGHIGWSSARWGMVTATQDRNAPLVGGMAGHPASSKKPSGT